MTTAYCILDVFTDRPFAGNALAVIPDATGLAEAQLLQVAREFNLSETVFVYPPADPAHAARVRIFTPARELPFAGHPTVGTAILLATLRHGESFDGTLALEEGVGPVPVRVRLDAGKAPFAQFSVAQLPQPIGEMREPADIAWMLRIGANDLVQVFAPATFSCGIPFLFVQVHDRSVLARCRLDPRGWDNVFVRGSVPEGVFVFTSDAGRPDAAFRARMFAPKLSVPEDPGTGSAVAALAGYLNAREPLPDGSHAWRIEQGVEMGRPCVIDLECDIAGGRITAVRVGGNAVIVAEGELLH